MHDLSPLNALGGTAPSHETVGTISLTEVADLALATVTARKDQADAVRTRLSDLLGAPAPGPNASALGQPYTAVWTAADQWMIGAPMETHEDIADQLTKAFAGSASVTEQSDGWVVIDLAGPTVVDLLERLCPAPVRRMQAGAATSSTIHQMRCFVLCGSAATFFRVLGPRSSAASLWHALKQAAHSVR